MTTTRDIHRKKMLCLLVKKRIVDTDGSRVTEVIVIASENMKTEIEIGKEDQDLVQDHMKTEEGGERKRSEIETVNLDLVAVGAGAVAGAEKGEGGVVVGKEAEGIGIGLRMTMTVETGNMIGEILGRIYLLIILSWLATCHFM